MKRNYLFESEVPDVENNENNENTPFLNKYGKDLTELARKSKLEPVIGRDKEVFEVLWILSRKNKNNPIIIGEPGVGKTAIVEGIAQKIANKDCPETLANKKIIYIDMGTLMAGASQQGEFEKRIKTLLKELETNPNIILFIDEIHMMVNTSMSIDAANMFKPALARGEIKLIGATTYNEYRNSIEKDGALSRRFIPVHINQPTEEETINILKNIKNRYEDFHKVIYSDKIIELCVKLSGRYITDRQFPDKAIDLMDEVGARVRLLNTKKTDPKIVELEKELLRIKALKIEAINKQDWENAPKYRTKETELSTQINTLLDDNKNIQPVEISEDNVYDVITLKTGIPTNKISGDEGTKLLDMDKELKMQIIGQDEAITKISKIIRRNKVGLKDPNRPGGVFLFLGSTGTGKTHTAKTLAKYIFGSENDMIRVDMSEYKEKHNVSRMIGSPPGYVGYDQAGQLTEKIRRKPYSLILLDEIEKAHPDVLSIFLQVFDEGHLTDGQGRKVDFKNTIIIMTSNIGAVQAANVSKPVGFTSTPVSYEEKQKETIKKELFKRFPPEFINRIDEIIIFSKLDKEQIYKLIDIEINKLSSKLKNLGYTLSITNNVKDLLIKYGYDENMGARPLKRAIQNYIEDPISDEILRKKIVDKIDIDYDEKSNKLYINGNIITEKIDNNTLKIRKWNSFKIFE